MNYVCSAALIVAASTYRSIVFLYSSFPRPAWVKADLLGYKFWENISIQFACVLFYSFYESCEIVGKKNGGLFGKFLHYISRIVTEIKYISKLVLPWYQSRLPGFCTVPGCKL